MPELRKDIIIGQWVIISPERSKRPSDFQKMTPPDSYNQSSCSLCTDPDATSSPGTGEEWPIKIIPGNNMALSMENDLTFKGSEIYNSMNAVGKHEIIVETPRHKEHIPEFSNKQIENIFLAYQKRLLDLKTDSRLKHAFICKSHGVTAGSKTNHSYSQLIALPVIPKTVEKEVTGTASYFKDKKQCVFCDIIHEETNYSKRIITDNEEFIAIAPFASRFPFETWILPVKHKTHFYDINQKETECLADIIKDCLTRQKTVLNDPDYNYILHTAPFEIEKQDNFCYHWHLKIIPLLSYVAGFEWGTDIYINPIPPEKAARCLREMKNK